MQSVDKALEQIKASAPFNLYVCCSGAGAGLQQVLWSKPGASSFLAGGNFPYDRRATNEFLGFAPEKYCDESMAVNMAMEAYKRAHNPQKDIPTIGLGLTAAVASERLRRGDNKVFVAAVTDDEVILHSAVFPKVAGEDMRMTQGELCDLIALDVVLEALQADYRINAWETTKTRADNLAFQEFMSRPYFHSNGKRYETEPDDIKAIFPGSFNPPHEGHFSIVEAAVKDHFNHKQEVMFSIASIHPAKGRLKVSDMLKRAKCLQGHNLEFTNAALYINKARQHEDKDIILGADTAVRILDPKWGPDPNKMMDEFKSLGTKLLIVPRTVNGKVIVAEDIREMVKHPQLIKTVFWFRNISSTEIRETS